jgi:hypothetical protein
MNYQSKGGANHSPFALQKGGATMNKQTLRRADLFMSYVLLVFSAAIFFMSIANFINPYGRDFEKVRAEEFKMQFERWFEQPALFPFIASILLAVCALGLRSKAIKDGAKFDFLTKEHAKNLFKSREFLVVATVVPLTAIYLFVLIPICRMLLNFFPTFQGFPFGVATFLYLFTFMFIFNDKTAKKILFTLFISLAATAMITYGFGSLALIPLP